MVEVIYTKRKGEGKIFFVRMTKAEALDTLASLAKQMRSGSPNIGRVEQTLDNEDGYFSIAVSEKSERVMR